MVCSVGCSRCRANASDNGQKSVYIPKGKQYHFMPVVINNISNVTLQIHGDLIASEHIDHWPRYQYRNENRYANIFNFTG